MALSDEQKEVLKSHFCNVALIEAFTELIDSEYRKRYQKLHIDNPDTTLDWLNGGCMALDGVMKQLKDLHKEALKTNPLPFDQA